MVFDLVVGYPFWSAVVLFVAVVVFTGIDKEVSDVAVWRWGMWGVSALFAMTVYVSRPGVVLEDAATVAAFVFGSLLLGTDFRPGLVTRWPRCNEDGHWLTYSTLYFFTGWAALLCLGLPAAMKAGAF